VERTTPAVVTEALAKTYRVHERAPGLAAALRAVVSRTYREVHAVRELSLTIEAGACVGFLGPNGAGKTTTLKMLSGLLHPSSGRVRVLGHEPRARAPAFLRRITLVMGQKQQLLWDLPPAETFALNRAIFDVPRAAYDETLAELSGLLELGDLPKKPTRQLSLGERMRCELAAALLHGPEVLFLDEPTIGLDVSMKLAVRDFLRAYRARTGATILLTSHDMDDVSALCERVLVIDQGRLRYDGDLKGLARRVRPDKRVTVHASGALDPAALGGLARVTSWDGATLVAEVSREQLSAALGALLATGAVGDVSVEDPPLEEVLRDFFDEARAEAP
jgi:ABC-2 type transport system ATP-binding protein